jgi:DNA-binding Lrp family transcriptional regulator
MVLDETDRALIAMIQGGLPLVPRPYSDIADALGLDEVQLFARLRALIDSGTIKRFGVVVRHKELGYRANAMVVWDVPDDRVAELGKRLGEFDCVTLCYRRSRRLPLWPYNLFCMIHGLDRGTVLNRIETITHSAGLQDMRRDILFSGRRFKQRGALYIDNRNGHRQRRTASG